MYRPTPPQRPLFGAEHRVSEEKRARLEQTWAHSYRCHALPLIDESQFQRFFHSGNGRPNASVRMILSVLIFKDLFDLTDGEALAQLEWNALWQYALDVEPEAAHTCQKTLHNFRAKLLGDDEGAGLFEGTTARIIEASGLRTQRQRLDSTHIVSNIKLLTRLGLFTATITRFLEVLRKAHPRLCGKVPEALRARYLDREGYFADARSSEAQRRLSDAGLDVYTLVSLFFEHKTVSALPEFGLLQRLLGDQCVTPEEEFPAQIELEKKPLSSSLQSPSDPDVTYGHKGKGYEVQLAETCDPENPFEVVTAVCVNGANESDQHQVLAVLDQVERTCGAAPARMHTDAGYGSGENILAARARGTDLLAPIGASASKTHRPLSDFVFPETGADEIRCPAGQTPVLVQLGRNGAKTQAFFSKDTCARCPLRDQCPTKTRRDYRVLEFSAADLATALRRVEQATPEFKEQHKLRSGIEATNSEGKRCHGLGKLRVRTKPRVNLSVRLKALALNVKRWMRHLTRRASAALCLEPVCAC